MRPLSSLILMTIPFSALANTSAGTAFFFNGKGDMFTNRHVIENCRQDTIMVRTSDYKWHKARVLAFDTRVDIAAISIDKKVDSFASIRTIPGSYYVSIPADVEDVFSAGFSDPVKNQFQLQSKWGQIQPWRNPNEFPFVNRMRMDAYPGASGSPILDYAGLLVGIVFASSSHPTVDYNNMRRSGYGDKWIFIHNSNAILLFSNKFKLQYSSWSEGKGRDPNFILNHASNITGLVHCSE